MVAISNLISSLIVASASQSPLLTQLNSVSDVLSHCDISHDIGRLNLVPINNSFTPPIAAPTFVGLAFGVQNYTCSPNNNFTNVGAVAQLYDVSCNVNATRFETMQVPLFESWNATQDTSIQEIIEGLHNLNPPNILAQHYFIQNPTTGQGLSPKWDFTSSGNPKFVGNKDAFIVVKGKGSVAAPNTKTDINWLDVVNIGGDQGGQIADEVFRTDTVGGQPPATCEHGKSEDISVKYTSKYWFFGGKLGGPESS